MTLNGHGNNIMFLSVSISHIVTIVHRYEFVYILVLNRFLIKKFGHVISQDMEYNMIGDTSAHF